MREYEYYHSLAAKGIDPEAVLVKAEEAERVGGEVDLALEGWGEGDEDGEEGEEGEVGDDGVEGEDAQEGEVEEDDVEDGEIEDDALPGSRLPHGISATSKVHGKQHGPQLPPSHDAEKSQLRSAEASTTQPHNTPAGSADQTLENLKMAYYWAGYYSGLYDGQRNAAASVAGHSNVRNGG